MKPSILSQNELFFIPQKNLFILHIKFTFYSLFNLFKSYF